MSLYQTYFKQQDKYTKLYGPKTIVFMQVGKFYEAYNDKTHGAKLARLEQLIGTKYICRDVKREQNETNKPNQLGFPTISLSRHLLKLTEAGYTIVVFDEVNNGEEIDRQMVGVFSPGTCFSDRQLADAKYLLTVYLVEEKQVFVNKNLMAIGITMIDVSTAESIVHEFYSNKDDDRFGLDELIRVIATYRPSEIIIYYYPQPKTKDNVETDSYKIKILSRSQQILL